MRTLSVLALVLALAALAACPSKPPPASLLEDDGSVPPADSSVPPTDGSTDALTDGSTDGSIDAPGDADAMTPDVIDLGFPDPLPLTRMMDNNDLIAFPIEITASQAGALVGWGVHAQGPPDTQVRMAIYSDALNQPGTLMIDSPTWLLADGVQPMGGFLLNAGSYWLLISVSDTITIGESTVADSRECFRALSFTVPFPGTWGSGSCFTSNPINIFIQIQPSP